MKSTDVEAIVVDAGKDYTDPSSVLEAHGVRFVSLLKISTEVLVQPGELVYADFEGVVVAPQARGKDGLHLALEKVGKENASRQELLNGKSLREVYTQYGVL